MKEQNLLNMENVASPLFPRIIPTNGVRKPFRSDGRPGVLVVTSYPPRECGIATYSYDLIKAINNKFSNEFSIKVCAMEAGEMNHAYPKEVKYVLNTKDAPKYAALARSINNDPSIQLVCVQHEFGFFHRVGEQTFRSFLRALTKPIITIFHTVLPNADDAMRTKVMDIVAACDSVVVMTHHSAGILKRDYEVEDKKISVIAHGTHLVPHLNKELLKEKYGLTGRKVLSTFGLLSSGKGIETTLNALPAIVFENPDVTFLIIGKTHPGVVRSEGEKYRTMLEKKVEALKLQRHVRFINQYLPLDILLEYLQLTDIYLFTSKDPNQAVSGTFSYALSCACPVVSTPIPHAKELLTEETGIIIDFENPEQLTNAVNRLMSDEPLRTAFSSNTLQRIVPSSWENSAIAHALVFKKIIGRNSGMGNKKELRYQIPSINMGHFEEMTTDVGMIQFSKINQPDLGSGYTLDDNARALIAMCMHYELTSDEKDVEYMQTYLDFIGFCQQSEGDFLNYVDENRKFTEQNEATNLADANGRAIWALGYFISENAILPEAMVAQAKDIMQRVVPLVDDMYSTRAMAFTIKGLYYYNLEKESPEITVSIELLADRLVQMYRHESEKNWQWFESYLTYANSILPESLLLAWLDTGNMVYQEIAKTSFDFLLRHTFNEERITVISNKGWKQKGEKAARYGEQPIDVAYTILAMDLFYAVFEEDGYKRKMRTAFNWFLGSNHLHQIIYNPCTGGCYDGLEEDQVNLNQGAESTLSYLMARMTIEKWTGVQQQSGIRVAYARMHA